MLKRNTVFILGAAFSSELGLPLGSGLKAQIIDLLPAPNRESPDRAFSQLLDDRPHCRNAVYELRQALPLASSIDNLVEHRSHDADFVRVAKWGIARAIAKAEQASTLGRLSTLSPSGSSYEALFQLIVAGVSRERMRQAFSRFAVVTFNYDRTLEVFLHRAICAYSGVNPDEATDILNQAAIIHAYGALGASEEGVARPLGFPVDDSGARIELDANGLRTFSEKQDSQSIETIRDYIDRAERLVVLGCAFHAQNLELVRPIETRIGAIYATAYAPAPQDEHARPAFDRFSLQQAVPLRSAVLRWPSADRHIAPTDRIQFAIEAMTCRQMIAMHGADWRE